MKLHPENRLLQLIKKNKPYPNPEKGSLPMDPLVTPEDPPSPPREPAANASRALLPGLGLLLLLLALFILIPYPLPQKNEPLSPATLNKNESYQSERPPQTLPSPLKNSATRDPIPPPKHINLLGIIDGEAPQAIVYHEAREEHLTLVPGDYFDNFKVSFIGQGQVIFTTEDETFTLKL